MGNERSGRQTHFPPKIAFIIMMVCVLTFLIVCVCCSKREKNAVLDREQYFKEQIDSVEHQIVQNAFDQAPVQMENSAYSHLYLLANVLWDYDVKNINIVSAQIVEFSNADLEEQAGVLLEGYALKVIDASGDEYIVWYASHLLRILKNGDQELLCSFERE